MDEKFMDEKLLSSYAGDRSESPLYLRWTPADVVACASWHKIDERELSFLFDNGAREELLGASLTPLPELL